MKKPSKIYSYHVANLREIEAALRLVSKQAKFFVATKDPENSLRSTLRLYSFLIGAWTETRLSKILHESSGFEPSERELIDKCDTQLDKWLKTIDLAFRKHHGITKATLNEVNLGVAHAARRNAIRKILDEDLRIIIEVRNKLAHGQWLYPLNNSKTRVESDKFQLINKENIQSLQFKYSMIRHLSDTIHDLVVSPEAFERDFDKHYRMLEQARVNLHKRKYSDFETKLQTSREKGRLRSQKK